MFLRLLEIYILKLINFSEILIFIYKFSNFSLFFQVSKAKTGFLSPVLIHSHSRDVVFTHVNQTNWKIRR